jgi:hypothetical protein
MAKFLLAPLVIFGWSLFVYFVPDEILYYITLIIASWQIGWWAGSIWKY